MNARLRGLMLISVGLTMPHWQVVARTGELPYGVETGETARFTQYGANAAETGVQPQEIERNAASRAERAARRTAALYPPRSPIVTQYNWCCHRASFDPRWGDNTQPWMIDPYRGPGVYKSGWLGCRNSSLLGPMHP